MIDKIFPPSYHLAMKWLASKDWLDVSSGPTGTQAKVKNIRATEKDYEVYRSETIQRAQMLLSQYCTSASGAFIALIVSEAIANGPKMFRPTFGQFIALENTEVSIPFELYEQPFPTVILEVPKEYKERIENKYKIANKVPSYVLCYKHHKDNVIAVCAWFGQDDMILNIMSPSPEYKTIEDAIVVNKSKRGYEFETTEEWLARPDNLAPMSDSETMEFEIAELVQRLGLNFSLMMTMLGTKVLGPLNSTPAKVSKQKRSLNNKNANPEKQFRFRKLLASTVYLCAFEQNIQFYDVQKAPEGSSRGIEGRSAPRTHWRRGHYRMQPCGPKNSQRKLKFIKPVLVMSKNFTGDISDTRVTYTGQDLPPLLPATA